MRKLHPFRIPVGNRCYGNVHSGDSATSGFHAAANVKLAMQIEHAENAEHRSDGETENESFLNYSSLFFGLSLISTYLLSTEIVAVCIYAFLFRAIENS